MTGLRDRAIAAAFDDGNDEAQYGPSILTWHPNSEQAVRDAVNRALDVALAADERIATLQKLISGELVRVTHCGDAHGGHPQSWGAQPYEDMEAVIAILNGSAPVASAIMTPEDASALIERQKEED